MDGLIIIIGLYSLSLLRKYYDDVILSFSEPVPSFCCGMGLGLAR